MTREEIDTKYDEKGRESRRESGKFSTPLRSTPLGRRSMASAGLNKRIRKSSVQLDAIKKSIK